MFEIGDFNEYKALSYSFSINIPLDSAKVENISYYCEKSEVFFFKPLFLPKSLKRKEVFMRRYIEFKVAEYSEQTDRGLERVVIFKRIYL